MEMKTRMENWNLRAYSTEFILNGRVYDHPRISDGRKINTSPITKLGVEGEMLLFDTHNTTYYCPLPQVDPSCQLTKKFLLETLPAQKDLWDTWLNNDPTRPSTPFAQVDMPLEDGAYLLALDADHPYLFVGMYQKNSQGYHWVIRRPYVNQGMFSDSVHLSSFHGENVPFDVRYFPEGYNELKFYNVSMEESVQIFLVNVGTEPVFYQEVQLNPWHYMELPGRVVKNKGSILDTETGELVEDASAVPPSELEFDKLEEESIPLPPQNESQLPMAGNPFIPPALHSLQQDSPPAGAGSQGGNPFQPKPSSLTGEGSMVAQELSPFSSQGAPAFMMENMENQEEGIQELELEKPEDCG